MKSVVFSGLAPEGNFVFDSKTYVNGDTLSNIPDNVADSLISAKLAIDANSDPEYTTQLKSHIKKSKEARNRALSKK
jgi:hypothetical protein